MPPLDMEALPHQSGDLRTRMWGLDGRTSVLGDIENSALERGGQSALSTSERVLLVEGNRAAFSRIITAKYDRGNFSENIGPSGARCRVVRITPDDVKRSGERISYEILVTGAWASFMA
jgi:hypothetical protein